MTLIVAKTHGPPQCAWCTDRVAEPFVCLPGLRLVLCPGCAVHVGQRLEEEGGDAQILEMDSLLDPWLRVRTADGHGEDVR
jgi:hypothetical protein